MLFTSFLGDPNHIYWYKQGHFHILLLQTEFICLHVGLQYLFFPTHVWLLKIHNCFFLIFEYTLFVVCLET